MVRHVVLLYCVLEWVGYPKVSIYSEFPVLQEREGRFPGALPPQGRESVGIVLLPTMNYD